MATADLVEQVRARIGWQSEVRTSIVEAGHVRRFCEAIGDDDPRWRDEAPPTFVVALGTETADDALATAAEIAGNPLTRWQAVVRAVPRSMSRL